MALVSPPADAAVGSESHSDSVFLDSTLLNGTLAGIGGAHADYIDGTTTGPGVVDNSGLDVNALNALGLNLPGVNVTAGQLLNLGAITQHAEAHPNGVSSSTTSTANLSLDLMQLLAPSPALSTATLNLGAVQSSASVDASNPTSLTRTTTIADATLNLQSPVVGDITTGVNGIVGPLNTQLNGLQSTITAAVNDSVGQIVNLVGGATGTANTTTNVTVNSRLDQAVANVLNQTLSTSLVTLDPSTGTITVNLAGGINLNNIPPNSTLLSPAVLQQVSADVATLMGQLQTNLNNVISNALDYVDVTITSNTTLTDPVFGTTLGGLTIGYTGTLQDLISGATPLTIAGTGSLAAVPVGAASTIVQNTVGAAVSTALGTAVADAGTAVNAIVTNATNTLAPALTALGGVAEVNLNVQNASDGIASQANVTAVQVRVLGGTVTELNLATSSVGPNNYAAITPTIDATNNPVPAGTDAPVSGSGWINNSTVTLQLVDAAGNPVGGPVTVATDATGAFPAGTSIPVPAGTAPGTYTVRATDAAGNTATDTITVPDTTPPPVTITGPADGSSTNDTTPTITGTTEPGATVHVVVRDNTGTVVFQGDATVAPNGSWTIDSTVLPEGAYTVAATATDPAGNTATANSTFTVDTTPPAVAITSPANGSSTNDTTPTVTGTTEPGATVHVVIRDSTGAIVFQGDPPVAANGTWAIDSTVLPDGPYTVTATATDPAGNTAADTTSFTVDSTAPVVDVVNPANGTTTGNPSPTVTGTVNEPAATVNVVVTDSVGTVVFSGPATVDASGNWSVDLATAGVVLTNGTYTATATATDPAGNTATDANTFTVDTAAPAVAITTPANGSSTQDTTPTIAGTTEPGATVHVVVRDSSGAIVFQGDPPVDAAGNWTIDSSVLPEGTYSVAATATDPAGNTATAAVSFTVDTTAPVVAITGPADGSRTNDTTPTITGTVSEPASTVHVVVTDSTGAIVFQGDATVAPDGTWTIDSSVLPQGSYTINATATDPAGNTGTATSGFVVDTTPPAVDVTGPANGSTTNDNTPTITGTTEPGATVHVVVTDAAGTVVFQGDATVAPGGGWTIDSSLLPDGPYTVTATATDAAGNTATDSNTFTVDASVPAAPVITSPADGSSTNNTTPTITGTGEPGATVTVTIDGQPAGTATVAPDGSWTLPVTTPLADGPHTVTATQTDAAGNTSPSTSNTFTVDTAAPAAPAITGPADGSRINDTTPTITGTGEPGATVTVTIDGQPAGTATVAADGSWTLPVTTPLAEGPHAVTATQTDAAGNTSPAATSTFTVDLTAPGVTITSPAAGSTTADNTPALTGTTEPGATVHVVVRDNSGAIVFQGDAPVDASGNWTIDSSQLPDGPYTVTATATDAAGNTTTASNAFTVDTTAPAVGITNPANGTTTNEVTPTVIGTGEPGATIAVTIDGTQVGTTTVAADGTWSVPVTTPLAPGSHTVDATATDAVGNTATATSTFTVDLTAPSVAITNPNPGDLTNDNTPTITGTSEPGVTNVHVVVTDANGQKVFEGDATVAADGNWTITPGTPLPDGQLTIAATATDAAGNKATDAVAFTVDTTAPRAPVITSPADGSSTNDTTPTVIGTGGPGNTVHVVITDSAGTVLFAGDATVGNDRTWTLDVTTPLPEGNLTVTATQTDAAGNRSPAASNAFTVDTTAPPAPQITSPTDGSATGDSTPTITGTGVPGATVTVTIDGQPVGSATVGPDGTWTVEVGAPLPPGDHTISATQTDAAGNTSAGAQGVSFTVTTAQGAGGSAGGAGGGTACPTTARTLRPACQPGTQGGAGAGTGAGTGAGGLADTGAAAGLGLLALLGGLGVAGGLLLVRRRREDRV